MRNRINRRKTKTVGVFSFSNVMLIIIKHETYVVKRMLPHNQPSRLERAVRTLFPPLTHSHFSHISFSEKKNTQLSLFPFRQQQQQTNKTVVRSYVCDLFKLNGLLAASLLVQNSGFCSNCKQNHTKLRVRKSTSKKKQNKQRINPIRH